MKLHYLEIVTPDIEATCATYENIYSVKFSEEDELLGGAKTCTLPDDTIIGVRAPLRETEEPIIRPYWLVDDIEKAVSIIETQGGEIAVPPLEIPSKGKFAIYIQGGIDQGFWQL